MKKILSVLLAFTIAFAVNTAVFAEDEVNAASVETTFVDQQVAMENFETSEISGAGASVVADPLDTNNKVLKLEHQGGGADSLKVYIPAAVSGERDYTVSMKIYTPSESFTNDDKMFYLQMLTGNGAAPQLQFWQGNNGYRLSDGVAGADIASGLFNAAGYTDFSFSVNKTSGTITYNTNGSEYIYTYGDALKPELLYDVTNVRIYAYDGLGVNPVYIDDVTVTYKKQIEYDSETLTQSFDAQMDYLNPIPQIKITNGTVSKWIEQDMKLTLIDAEDDTNITEVETVVAKKAQSDESGTFEFLSDLPASITPGYYYVNIAQWIDGVKKHDSQKLLYIATADHLISLPGDFTSLPENEADAKSVIESYLPCFLADEELNELFPKENGSYTTQGDENLTFMTKYFMNCGKTFNLISDVQTEFGKAKGYLKLKNAANSETTKAVLTEGGYLAEYEEDEVFTENETEFFTHFDTKRTNEQSPLLSDSAVADALRYAYALTALNNAERSEIEGLVGAYNDIYLIDLTREGIDEVEKDTLYSALYNKNYTSVSLIDSDFAAKLTQLLDKKDEVIEEEQEVGSNIPSASERPSLGDTSSSSGGGGKNTVVKTDVPLVQPVIEPENPQRSVFKDTDGHWAEKEIELLYKNSITTGFGDGNFKPENTLTRAQMVAMIARILPGEEGEGNPFTDVSENDWYFKAAKEVAAKGIVLGTDGNLLPNEAISREQLFVMIYRALNAETADSVKEVSFADDADISSYAADAIAYLADKGIISGYPDNTIRPKNTASRAETAKLLCTAFSDIIK